MPVWIAVQAAARIGPETVDGVGAARGTLRRSHHVARQNIAPVDFPRLPVLHAPCVLGILNLLQIRDAGAALTGPAACRHVGHAYRAHKAYHGHDNHQLNEIKSTIAFHICCGFSRDALSFGG